MFPALQVWISPGYRSGLENYHILVLGTRTRLDRAQWVNKFSSLGSLSVIAYFLIAFLWFLDLEPYVITILF